MAMEPVLAEELASVFARMSGLLLSQETVKTALGIVTRLAAETIPGSIGAGVTLVDSNGHKTTSGATSPLVTEADNLQYQLNEGPCLSAWSEQAGFRIDDMQTDRRWPSWAPSVARLGLVSAVTTPLVTGGARLGAMKVYAATENAYTEREEELLAMFAVQAAVLLANVQSLESAQQLSDQLKDALRSRDVIGMAKGVLMAREGVDENAAFAMLASASQREGKKLRQVADAIIANSHRRRR